MKPIKDLLKKADRKPTAFIQTFMHDPAMTNTTTGEQVRRPCLTGVSSLSHNAPRGSVTNAPQ